MNKASEARLKTVDGDLTQVAKLLPDPHRHIALFLSNLCEQASDSTEQARKTFYVNPPWAMNS